MIAMLVNLAVGGAIALAAHSGSTAPNPSSISQCSPSAATHHNSQAEPHAQIQQESATCEDMGGSSGVSKRGGDSHR